MTPDQLRGAIETVMRGARDAALRECLGAVLRTLSEPEWLPEDPAAAHFVQRFRRRAIGEAIIQHGPRNLEELVQFAPLRMNDRELELAAEIVAGVNVLEGAPPDPVGTLPTPERLQ